MTPDESNPDPQTIPPRAPYRRVLIRQPFNPDLLFIGEIRRRKIPFTYLFMAINFLVFLVMEVGGGTTDPAVLIAFGAKSNPAIDSGEIWRFLTPVFIHIGILHLAFNSYALWIVGQQVERLYGSARFVVLYVLMGIAGVAGSYLFNPGSLSAGASGAIFGLFGVLLMFGMRNRGRVPPFLGRAIRAGILPVIVLNLAIGFAIPAIDNAAHVAGLLAGMALAAVIGFQAPGARTGVFYRTAQVAALGMVLGGFQQAAVHYESPGSVDRFIDAVSAAERAFGSSSRAVRNDASDRLESSESLLDAIGVLEEAPSLSGESDRILSELEGVLQAQYQLIEDIRQTGEVREPQIRRLERNTEEFRRILDALYAWVEMEGGNHGIRLRSGTESEF